MNEIRDVHFDGQHLGRVQVLADGRYRSYLRDPDSDSLKLNYESDHNSHCEAVIRILEEFGVMEEVVSDLVLKVCEEVSNDR